MKLLALTLLLSLAACSEYTQPAHVAKAAELCKNNGGWKMIDPTIQMVETHYRATITCADRAQFLNYRWSTDHATH